MRTPLLIVLLLALYAPHASAQQRRIASRDGWLSGEKPLHLAVSATATVAGTEIARRIGVRGELAPAVIGAGAAFALGLTKEWMDIRRGGWADPKDMAWNMAGIAVGIRITIPIGAASPQGESPRTTGRGDS
jgi:uncharacterized protein YfiM (DUF2279 family)